MKRLHLWLRELSLTQQLLSIIFLVVSIFSIFFLVFLSNNVNNFVHTELFKLLHSTQNNVYYYIDNNIPLEDLQDIKDTNVIHLIYNVKSDSYTVLGNHQIPNDVFNTVINTVNTYESQNQDYVYSNKDSSTLYSIIKVNDDYVLISLLSDSYRNEFKNALTNSIININVLVVSMLLVILTLWISSLIHPLNQIRNYIDKIKNEEDAVLKVDRKDEIGEVANALVQMQNEIKRQNQIKEEMVQNISHDLKTPISTIKSYSESIKDGVYPYGTLEKSVDVIIEHADRLEKKVYSLIVLNKMGYLLDNIEPGTNLYMPDVIDKAILSMQVIKKEINIERNVEDVYFHGEEEPWRIVIENLIDNAIRYAKSSIIISLKPGELMVTNDGPNISEERLSKLFRPYEKGTEGQFGLGLSIVYRVATTYGYHVSAENLTNGVNFRIYNNEQMAKEKIINEEIAEEAEIMKKVKKKKVKNID